MRESSCVCSTPAPQSHDAWVYLTDSIRHLGPVQERKKMTHLTVEFLSLRKAQLELFIRQYRMKIEGLKTSSKNWLYYFIEAMEMSLNECSSCAKKAEQQNKKEGIECIRKRVARHWSS